MEKETHLKSIKVDDGENVPLNAISTLNSKDSKFDDNLFEDVVLQLESKLRIMTSKHKKKQLVKSLIK